MDQVFSNPAAAGLAHAVIDGNVDAAKQAVADGANVNAVDADGLPLLQWVMKRQDRDGFRLLLDLGADPGLGAKHGQTALGLAAMGRQTDWLEVLLDRGVSPDLPNTVDGAPALFDALRVGNHDNLRLLLARGARLDATDRNGRTALHKAASVNDPAAVLLLLEAGADPRATAANGATFQDYLFDGDPKHLNAPTRQALERIDAVLRAKGITPKPRGG